MMLVMTHTATLRRILIVEKMHYAVAAVSIIASIPYRARMGPALDLGRCFQSRVNSPALKRSMEDSLSTWIPPQVDGRPVAFLLYLLHLLPVPLKTNALFQLHQANFFRTLNICRSNLRSG